MTAALAAKFDLRVPRYTSYPTAPHFSAAVDAERYRRWLGELPSKATLSLYLHVPFCPSLCWFCGCSTRVVNRYGPVAAYLSSLAKEIDLVAEALGSRRAVSHIHFGGGSPTMLTGDDLVQVVARLRAHFAVAERAEIAVEIDPRHLRPEFVEGLAAAGVTRASLGVQDFGPSVQQAINRVQSFALTRGAVESLRAAGINRLNLDLIYGLPRQTVARVRRSARLALMLAPDRVALFGYAHVPWAKRHQRLIDEAELPGPDERLEQFSAASQAFVKGGMVAIGLDHFAAPSDGLARASRTGTLRRNFQGYTDDGAETLIGIGPSAIGAVPQGYAQNATDVRVWPDAVDAGRLAVVRGFALDDDDRLRGEVIERLMCDLEVDVAEACRRHGRAPDDLATAFSALEPLVSEGLVEVEGYRVRVPEAGRPFVRLACAAFDAYLGTGTARHAQAL